VATAGGHRRDPLPLRLSAEPLVLTLWTGDPERARRADAAGVDRIGLDLERHGKRERQAGLGTWISGHDEADLPALAAALTGAELFARIEPVSAGGADQAARLAGAGARVLMVPMFRTADEVAAVAVAAPGAAIVPLAETREALRVLDEVLAIDGVDELHVGINDLSLALGLRNRFAVLCHPAVERAAASVHAAGARFGLGGLGRAGQTGLPVPADLVYARHAQLGATSALVSRAFGTDDLGREVFRARERMAWWQAQRPDALALAERRLRAAVDAAPTW
jgi:2-keto-3-deoxy-L-rhamnonate aldolase RhmA